MSSKLGVKRVDPPASFSKKLGIAAVVIAAVSVFYAFANSINVSERPL
jgi:hypothetical protein